jgi:pimeloyl-ACP methyl ester carboxylesterase
VEALAKGRQVIAVHLQGHGRTHDIHCPLRFELMADDIATLITQLGLGKADVMGYSWAEALRCGPRSVTQKPWRGWLSSLRR